ncbi:hypothetical protein V3C99_011732, partial [Haemonchus contortus]
SFTALPSAIRHWFGKSVGSVHGLQYDSTASNRQPATEQMINSRSNMEVALSRRRSITTLFALAAAAAIAPTERRVSVVPFQRPINSRQKYSMVFSVWRGSQMQQAISHHLWIRSLLI